VSGSRGVAQFPPEADQPSAGASDIRTVYIP